MWTVLLGILCLAVPTGLVLWMLWPARTGAVAAGERGNEGLIPTAGEYGGVGPSPDESHRRPAHPGIGTIQAPDRE